MAVNLSRESKEMATEVTEATEKIGMGFFYALPWLAVTL